MIFRTEVLGKSKTPSIYPVGLQQRSDNAELLSYAHIAAFFTYCHISRKSDKISYGLRVCSLSQRLNQLTDVHVHDFSDSYPHFARVNFMHLVTTRRLTNERVSLEWTLATQHVLQNATFFEVILYIAQTKTWQVFRFAVRPSSAYLFTAGVEGFDFSLDHTQTHTTFGRTPLDEGSAHSRDLYLTTQTLNKRQLSMPPEGFEPAIPASARPQT
jgi:hypothetical protein